MIDSVFCVTTPEEVSRFTLALVCEVYARASFTFLKASTVVEAPDLLCAGGVLFHSLRRPSTTTRPLVPFYLVVRAMKLKMTITDHRAMENSPRARQMLVRRGHCSHSANRCTEFQMYVRCSNRIWLHKIIENRVTIRCDHALLCSSTIQTRFITKVSSLILCLCAAITISSAFVNVGSI